jgi:hypothetical protein
MKAFKTLLMVTLTIMSVTVFAQSTTMQKMKAQNRKQKK